MIAILAAQDTKAYWYLTRGSGAVPLPLATERSALRPFDVCCAAPRTLLFEACAALPALCSGIDRAEAATPPRSPTTRTLSAAAAFALRPFVCAESVRI